MDSISGCGGRARLPELHLSVLGGFELRAGGALVALPVSARRLAAFLALHDRAVQRRFVAGTLWPDVPEERSGGSLRTALWRLSRPGVRMVDGDRSSVWLMDRVRVDLRESSARARRLVRTPEAWQDEDITAMAETGDVLPDFYDDWLLLERERFRQLRIHALEALSGQLVGARRFGDALETALAAVALEPLRESAHRAVVAAHLGEGNPGEAIRQYRSFRTLLQRELGVEPSSTMRDLMVGLPMA